MARNFDNISQSDKETIRQLFINKKCIPTKLGMKIPTEAYFENVNLFSDLPTIQFQRAASVHNLMKFFGVREVWLFFIIIYFFLLKNSLRKF